MFDTFKHICLHIVFSLNTNCSILFPLYSVLCFHLKIYLEDNFVLKHLGLPCFFLWLRSQSFVSMYHIINNPFID